MTEISPQYLERIRDNKRVRQRLAFEDPFWFCLLYLRHHFKYSFAPFHLEMFHLIRQTEHDFMAIMAFRESGKSTILNMANILWSILGKPKKNFVLIMSQTQEQAKNHFSNIKHELETNELLREDFGPFTEHEGTWNKLSLELEYHGSKIMSLIRDQSIRGLKYNQHRPDLIICDDLEDAASVNDESQRQTLDRWFQSEIIPLGNEKTRIVVLGNLLSHFLDDPETDRSFILRLRNEILQGKIKGIFRAYPLIDDYGKNLWPGRFPDHESVRKLRSKMSRKTWILEYLLKSYGQKNDEGPNVSFYNPNITHEDWIRKGFRDFGYTVPDAGEMSHLKPQTALIEQMNDYVIRVPTHTMAFFPRPDDPRYLAYLKDMHFYQNDSDLEKRIAMDIKKTDG